MSRRQALHRIAQRRTTRGLQPPREYVAAVWRRAHPCPHTPENVSDGETYLAFIPKWREWRIPYRPGCGGGEQQIRYCPFCGAELPASLFDLWFQRLADIGLHPPALGAPPAEYDSATWWEAQPGEPCVPGGDPPGVGAPAPTAADPKLVR